MKQKFSIILCTIILSAMLVLPSGASDTIKGAAQVNTASTALNVRQKPSSSAKVVDTLPKNSYLTLITKSNNYWYVRYNNTKYGYCHEKYVKQISSTVRVIKTTSGNLRVRSNPSLSASVINYLPSGTYVTVLSTSNDFSKIIYNGNKIGYVSKTYLVKPESFTHKYPGISLKIPDYKQTDSRWSKVTLGSSGQTIGKIGCATTALAMTESYRTGTTIYPDAMSKKLTYTSGGAVYWPQNYTIITSQNDHLTKIYNALKQGKPVIVGAKNSYGGQHYVVVTGIKNCDSLTASSFYINDPGSSTKKTLNEFYNDYPNFYKMLYVK